MSIEKNQPTSSEVAGAFAEMVKAIYPVSQEALEFVTKKMTPVYIQKGSLLVSNGQHCDHLYFVVKGVMRGYVQQGTKEITTWITAENELVTSISSFYQKVPSIENIEALEDCTLGTVHRDDLNYMYQNFPEVNTFVRIVLEKYYQDAEERAYIARLTEATGKYHRFINTKSHLLNRIPLKFIASYLGMTLETLSRIRSKITYTR